MKVLTVYAHPNPSSFTYAVLDPFTVGLTEAGHEPDVLDLYALKFDPSSPTPTGRPGSTRACPRTSSSR